jgi:GT2 family glycosyltransferase
MKVHIIKPYSIDKDLGRAYNEAMSRIPDGDWACLMDYDTMFLTPDCGAILHGYAQQWPQNSLFTCYTNRLHESAKDQLLDGVVSENLMLDYHMERAYNQKHFLFQATPLKHEISGFLMMIKKETWNVVKFREGIGCLGVDNHYCWDLMKAGKLIYRMDGLYVLHLYRLKNGVKDKTHLR